MTTRLLELNRAAPWCVRLIDLCWIGRSALILAFTLLAVGCTTPDLKPFANATATVAASLNAGGEMALAPIAAEPVWVNNVLIPVGAPNHPAAGLATEWERRRKAADAILLYSGSLAAINDAAGSRKANASALLDSVKGLATAIPGVGIGSNAAGNLLISAASGVVEIKAWRDMGAAVKNADPAIRIIADIVKKDLSSMSGLFVTFHQDEIIMVKSSEAWSSLRSLEKAFRATQDARRKAVSSEPGSGKVGADLAQVDALLHGVDRDLGPLRDKVARHETAIADGRRFYAKAIEAVDAWATAHHDLVQTFEQKRTPNIALLIARARELDTCLDELKASRKPAPNS